MPKHRKPYDNLQELRGTLRELARGPAHDLSIGNPSPEQFELAREFFSIRVPPEHLGYTNELCGIASARRFMANYLGVNTSEHVFVIGTSSLALISDALGLLLRHVQHPSAPLFLVEKPTFESFLPILGEHKAHVLHVPMTAEGPDIEALRVLVADHRVCGMFAIPYYQNPTGICYSRRTLESMAAMKPANPQFRFFMDLAYAHHSLAEHPKPLPSVWGIFRKHRALDRLLLFGSTSKVIAPAENIAAVAATPANAAWLVEPYARVRGISGPGVARQYRTVEFLEDMNGLRAHMRKHRAILAPRARALVAGLEKYLGGKKIATWSNPAGGYFISLTLARGSATALVAYAASAGLTTSPADWGFVAGESPDNHVRLGFCRIPEEEADRVAQIIATAATLAHLEADKKKVRTKKK